MSRTKDAANSEQRRQQIIWTCYQLLSRSPHHEVTFERLAKQSGLSRGLLHYYFGSKDRLIIATIDTFLARQRDVLLAIASDDKPVRERVDDLIAAIIPSRSLVEERAQFLAEVWSFAKTAPEVLAGVQRAYADLNQVLLQLLEVAIAEGYVAANTSPRVVTSISAMFEGLGLQLIYAPTLAVETLREDARRGLERLLGIETP